MLALAGLSMCLGCGRGSSDDNLVGAGERAPAPQLFDADVGVEGVGVWVAGGATQVDGTWKANDHVLTFDSSGRVSRDQQVAVRDDHYLFDSAVIESEKGRRWLVALECSLPGGPDNSLGCGLDASVIAGALTDDGRAELMELKLPEITGVQEAGPGIARFLGVVQGGQVVILRAESMGLLGGSFYNFNLYLWDPETGGLSTLEVPKGTQTFESFCDAGDTIRMIEPTIAEDPLRVEGVTVLELDPASSKTWRPLSSIDLRGQAITSGGVACSDRSAVLWYSGGDGLRLTALDATTMKPVGDTAQFAIEQRVDFVSFEPGGEGVAVSIANNAPGGGRLFLDLPRPGADWLVVSEESDRPVGATPLIVRSTITESGAYKQLAAAAIAGVDTDAAPTTYSRTDAVTLNGAQR